MRALTFPIVLLTSSLLMAADTELLKPVPISNVKITDGLWAERIKVVREKTIAHNFQQCEEKGRMRNFDRAAKKLDGRYEGRFPFDDSDPYKVIEGAAYILMQQRDPELEKQIDAIVARIGAAQQPDGYVGTWYSVRDGLDKRWSREKDMHETYNAGHMIEAAVAYFQATGKRNLLDIAIKFADCIDNTFGPGKKLDPPGHEEIELALIKLYDVTKDEKYVKLAEFFIEQRGQTQGRATNRDYDQDHLPVKQQREIVGHAVRAMYLYCGVADIALMKGDKDYIATMDAIWHDIIDRKMYVTAGIGPSAHNEGFTIPYDLPNDSAYAETCAGIGLALWNHRLTQLHQDAKYADIFERGAYNGILSGISLEGTTFFYVNPLASRGRHHRTPWFDCPCCPPNIERFIASMGERIYFSDSKQIMVNHYIASEATVDVGSNKVKLTQKTKHPWEGDISITVEPQQTATFEIKLRIPGWCEAANISVNGSAQENLHTFASTYATLKRAWKKGDVIDIFLSMEPQRVYADPKVKANVGRVAIQRGPIIYCLEGVDNGGAVRNLVLSKDAPLTFEHRPDLLGGVTVVKGKAKAVIDDDPAHDEPRDFVAVPYYAWDNRARGQMIVWLAEDRSVVERPRDPNVAVSASFVHAALEALNDRSIPEKSNDSNVANFDFWPHKGTAEWVQYDYKQPRNISECEVYWFDDSPRGECRLPASWKLLYKDGDAWKPVEGASEYGVKKDQFNHVTFTPMTTSALRMEIQLPERFSAGILEWRVK